MLTVGEEKHNEVLQRVGPRVRLLVTNGVRDRMWDHVVRAVRHGLMDRIWVATQERIPDRVWRRAWGPLR